MSGYYSTQDGRHLFRLLDGERTNGYSGPYVVIDPEDREAVKRLVSLFESQRGESMFSKDDQHMQAALREYANPKPPRPDEPQGLGAVVEDEGGALWTSVTNRGAGDRWQPNNYRSDDMRREYAEIAVVRVLSPGVEVEQ